MGCLLSEMFESFQKLFPRFAKDIFRYQIYGQGLLLHFNDGLTAIYDHPTKQLHFIRSNE